MAAAYAFQSYAESAICESITEEPSHKKNPSEILKEIYKEVIELGSYDNEDFIKREFHINLDGNDENEEEHVVIMIYTVQDREKMLVQVTYFGPVRNYTKYAKKIKMIEGYIKGDKIEIEKCDYDEKEIKSLLVEILNGIRNKKKLLELIDRK